VQVSYCLTKLIKFMFGVNVNQKDIDVEELLSQNTLCLCVTISIIAYLHLVL
jgi:hypothetical protein